MLEVRSELENQVAIFKNESGDIEVSVKLSDETVWLSLNQLTEVFGRDKSVISRHLSNIFKEGELEQESTVAKFATVDSCSNSSSLNILLKCLEITDLSLSKTSAS